MSSGQPAGCHRCRQVQAHCRVQVGGGQIRRPRAGISYFSTKIQGISQLTSLTWAARRSPEIWRWPGRARIRSSPQIQAVPGSARILRRAPWTRAHGSANQLTRLRARRPASLQGPHLWHHPAVHPGRGWTPRQGCIASARRAPTVLRPDGIRLRRWRQPKVAKQAGCGSTPAKPDRRRLATCRRLAVLRTPGRGLAEARNIRRFQDFSAGDPLGRRAGWRLSRRPTIADTGRTRLLDRWVSELWISYQNGACGSQ